MRASSGVRNPSSGERSLQDFGGYKLERKSIISGIGKKPFQALFDASDVCAWPEKLAACRAAAEAPFDQHGFWRDAVLMIFLVYLFEQYIALGATSKETGEGIK